MSCELCANLSVVNLGHRNNIIDVGFQRARISVCTVSVVVRALLAALAKHAQSESDAIDAGSCVTPIAGISWAGNQGKLGHSIMIIGDLAESSIGLARSFAHCAHVPIEL